MAEKFVEQNYPKMVFEFIENQFQQLSFYNGAKNKTAEEIQEKLISDVKSVIQTEDERVDHIFSNIDLDSDTRLSWKYGTIRGVYGAPLLFLSEVMLAEEFLEEGNLMDLIRKLLTSTSEMKGVSK